MNKTEVCENERPRELVPALGVYASTAVTVGAMIGSGVFVSTGGMARASTSGTALLMTWFFAGVMTLVGALTLCELASQMPRTGGLYVYLREAFGEPVGFFFGWANFMVAGSGAIGAIAFIFASYVNEFVPLWEPPPEIQQWSIHLPYLGSIFPGARLGEKIVASGVVIFLTIINVIGVRVGGALQSVSTTVKVLALVVVVIFGLSYSNGSFANVAAPNTSLVTSGSWGGLALLVTALVGGFWSYDGWANVTFIAGEVRRPARTLPLALMFGTAIVMLTYLLVNLAYLYVLPVDDLAAVPGDRIASAMMRTVAGPAGAVGVALLILLSTFDTTNSAILTNARVCYAMAREGLFVERAGRISRRFGTPATAIWMQCGWTLVLLVSGSFGLITSMYVFVNWLFYLLTGIAVFVLRRRKLPSAFTIPGYPYVPAFFILFTSVFLVMTLVEDINAYRRGEEICVKSLIGLVLVMAGAPFYAWTRWRRRLASS